MLDTAFEGTERALKRIEQTHGCGSQEAIELNLLLSELFKAIFDPLFE
jgi:hypothetical protein